ncbi:MAG TPA: MFS transporter [Candidatus Methylacidiphilales bacterium]|nr:MFS transporter [Candidatus Methylacidiphilales bacterium]
MASPSLSRLAFRFVLLIGIVNLFADLTYEGARSINGPFLGSLGASATIVGFVAGFGELAGYGVRSIFGYFADKTRRYWLFVFAGYAMNMLAVPALALAGNWPLAATLMILERTGRAIRKPATEAMISHAGKSIGQGWVFGLNEALDQTGATMGPLIASLVLYVHGNYHHAFAVFLISALLCLGTLAVARFFHPDSGEVEKKFSGTLRAGRFSKPYWFYMIAGALIAAGFADFSLVAFHFQKTGIVSQNVIPIFYAVAMATGAVTSFLFGWLLDKAGSGILLPAFFLSALSVPCLFAGGFAVALAGMLLWGLGMGAQDSMLKAVLAGVTPPERRGAAFGLFDTGFGLAWFAGSAAMGLLYDQSITALIAFSVVLQLLALPFFVLARKA